MRACVCHFFFVPLHAFSAACTGAHALHVRKNEQLEHKINITNNKKQLCKTKDLLEF